MSDELENFDQTVLGPFQDGRARPKSAPIDAAALARAKQEALRTGRPQPVKDTNGKTAYWIDWQGQVVPAEIAQAEHDSPSSRSQQAHQQSIIQGTINSSTGGLNNAADAARQRAGYVTEADATQQRTAAATAEKLAAANQLRGYVWINGHLAQITGFAKDGTPIVSVQGGKASQKPTTGPDGVLYGTSLPANQTAFGALPGSSGINGGAIFNLSTGPANIFTGQSDAGDGYGTPGTSYTPQGVGLTPAAAEHSQGAESVSNAKNQMTVAQGVQWFLNLSVQHPDQYKQLVDELVAAHYITPSLGQSAGGGYGFDAAGGFAKATAELASVNTTPGGAGVGLFDFLKGKADAAKQYAESQVQPVNRSYQDPATLKYVARNAAQAVLGRDLTPAEQQAFEAQFRGQEDGYYNGVDASNKAQAGAALMNTTAPGAAGAQPDATGEAAQYMYSPQFTTQRMGYSMLEYVKAFQDLLGNGKL